MVRVVTVFAWAVALAVCVGVLVGFAGAVHPAADTLALLRLPLGFLCLFALLLPGPRGLRLLVLCTALLAGGTSLPRFLSGPASGDVTVYAKNVLWSNRQIPALADDIRQSGADVVALQEISDRNMRLLNILEETYPHQHLCRFNGWNGIAVLSRTPIHDNFCTPDRAGAGAKTTIGGQDVWAVSAHLSWPYPYGNAQSAAELANAMEQLDAPVVLAGDFNTFPWMASVASVRRAGGLRAAGPLRPTFTLSGVPLFLDHAYAPGGGQISYRPALGSDHRGLLAQLRLDR